jgi:hypothetical protein
MSFTCVPTRHQRCIAAMQHQPSGCWPVKNLLLTFPVQVQEASAPSAQPTSSNLLLPLMHNPWAQSSLAECLK